jgi:hypothetical protein
MARRGQRNPYDNDDGWERTSAAGQRRVNGDYSSSSLNATSMTRELDDLMRIIEADWNVVTSVNVRLLFPF